ncbi:phosphoketolase [Candidatus Peregrinibacteria bacterium HGW-Peregrinibacteria-1]|jgi:xylulose-5-phosphate/fructose-6-phosphate phosphoketolase|nr:MAG: phosphoketolase [Candidatus Peregrinibacteria bacterium HGW-Peregrinibacteria-1]
MKITSQHINWLKAYTRLTDYLGVAQIYLKDNFYLEEPLHLKHLKERPLGHWGTVPGLNLIYAALNLLVTETKSEVLMVTGPGHGAPSTLANLYLEKTLYEFYPQYTLDRKGAAHIIKDFSWPHSPFPSHVTPSVPGSILEGGELGYSLATAFGAVLDNPDLIAAVAVGDGEAETGPIATAWHTNKFLNPRTSGAVLPIVHINGYKISNSTIYSSMDDTELTDLFHGYGYEPIIVSAPKLESKMLEATFKAYEMIRDIQKRARTGKTIPQKPKWPVILLRSPKGWKGITTFKGKPIEDSFRSHGVPIENLAKDPDAFPAVKEWLESYNVHELLDKKGVPTSEVLKYVPTGKLRIGMNTHAIGGNHLKELKIPRLSNYSISKPGKGTSIGSSMEAGALLLRDIIKENPENFRIFCPDEVESNKLGAVFQETNREYQWPISDNAENTAQEGRVIEMLSEHNLQGLYQGYLLTGRHGLLVSYEAFIAIISSMVDQHAKFLKQSLRVPWRKPVPSAVYLLTSVGWRQEHNGYSHQNPSFVSNILLKHGQFSQVYYPADANSLLVALEETLQKKDSISVIVSDKRPMRQWQTLSQARRQAKTGFGVWDWVGGVTASKNPDIVVASAGDHITQEAIDAVVMAKKLIPEVKIRYVNVSELTALGLGDYLPSKKNKLTQQQFNEVFTDKKPIVFNYHGYTSDIQNILWPYVNSDRLSLHGYSEEGSTTTPFDMKLVNGVSSYHLLKDIINYASKTHKSVSRNRSKLLTLIDNRIEDHQNNIIRYGTDPNNIATF